MQTLSELAFRIHPETGAWIPTARADARPPYVRFERRPLAPGETYRVRHAGGHLTDERRPFPAGQTYKIVQILVLPDGQTEEVLYYCGPDGEPLDQIPGVANQ